MWGLTAATDLCSETDEKAINVLTIGQSDCRHVIKTLAKKYTTEKTVKIFIHEPRLENIARSLLFLHIALESNLGLARKSSQFLDLYGNILIRPATRQFLTEASKRLIKIITDVNYAEKTMPMVSFDGLKYKDRDELERIFQFWAKCEDFPILNFWEERSRSLLGIRYDSRDGVFDWDLHMRYRPYGAQLITTQEYKTFREKGVAFLEDDTHPCLPNPIFANFQPGSKSPLSGFFGDITTGPYPAYGLDSENKNLMKKFNGQYGKSATEVSLYNIEQLFYEMEHQTPYHPVVETGHSLTVKKDYSENIQQEKKLWRNYSPDGIYSPINIPNVDIIFLPAVLKNYPSKPYFRDFFDLVTVPESLVQKMPEDWHIMCKSGCRLLIESSKFILHMGKDALQKSRNNILQVLVNVEALGEFDRNKDDFMKFIVKK